MFLHILQNKRGAEELLNDGLPLVFKSPSKISNRIFFFKLSKDCFISCHHLYFVVNTNIVGARR